MLKNKENNTGTNMIMLPLKYALGFIVFTEVFFFLGPIDYQPMNPIILILFLVTVNICLYAGYKKEVRVYRPRISSMPMDSYKVLKLIKFLLVFASLIKPIGIYVGWQLSSFSLSAFVNKFFIGLYSPSEVYAEYGTLTGGTSLSLLLVLLSPILYMAMPMGVYLFKELPKFHRILVVFLIVTEIIYCLGLGIRKLMLDEILIVAFSFLSSRGLAKIKIFKNKRMIVLMILAVIGLIYYFTYSSLSRNATEDITNLQRHSMIRPWYIEHTSPEFYHFLANIHMYLCHSYNNLSVALHDFFTFDFDRGYSFGIGNNSFTLDMFQKYLGINLKPYTYQYLLNKKYGLDIGQQWMTIYPWLANDVTFLGVPFVIYYFGRLFARFWMECLYRTNVYAIPLLSIMAITLFYSFANNQGLSYSFLPALLAAILYMNAKKKTPATS